MILFFDTETTGLPNKGQLSGQPYIVQLALSLYDDNRRPVFETSTLIRLPEGMDVPAIPKEVHGIDELMCANYGVAPATALALFNFAMERCHTSVAHNYQFDRKLVQFLADRLGSQVLFTNPFCTMICATPVVNLPPTEKMLRAGYNKPKAPTLAECWRYFFQEELSGAHDALVDTRGCARVYYELADQGLISKEGQAIR